VVRIVIGDDHMTDKFGGDLMMALSIYNVCFLFLILFLSG